MSIKYDPLRIDIGDSTPTETVKIVSEKGDEYILGDQYFIYGKVVNPEEVIPLKGREDAAEHEKDTPFIFFPKMSGRELATMIFRLCYQSGDDMVASIQMGLEMYKLGKELNFKVPEGEPSAKP